MVVDMRVIERFCQGKRADQSLNEDGLIVTDAYAAVVDGVTSKSMRRLWRPSGGVVAKDLLLDAIAALPQDASMREAQSMLDSRLHERYERFECADCAHDDFDPCRVFAAEPWERLQANAVIYSDHRREAWLFGDCQIMVNGVQTPTVKRVDVLLGDLRSFAAQALALGGDTADTRDTADIGDTADSPAASSAPAASSDPTRALIVPFLRLQTRFANQRGEYGYFVFDGFTDPDYPIRTIAVNPGDEVVLASDGYPRLRPTLAASERELARLREADPQLIHEYRSTKGFSPDLASFDDRTYLRFIA